MDRNPNDRIDVDGHPENTDRELNLQPGRLDDIESAEAYATRTGQRDVTGEFPEGAAEGGPMSEGERLHDREQMSAREGMADTSDAPMERGERQSHTGGGANRV
ncbi:MAG TPA: hypothetical protein VHG08_05355 [Longimicrobium sp.]|nr:hypothetical protein [Longimicrobium sp.]